LTTPCTLQKIHDTQTKLEEENNTLYSPKKYLIHKKSSTSRSSMSSTLLTVDATHHHSGDTLLRLSIFVVDRSQVSLMVDSPPPHTHSTTVMFSDGD